MFDKVGAFYELWEESSTRAHNMLTESGVDWGGDWLDLDQFMAVLSPAGRPAFGLASVIYDLMGYATGSGVLGASTEELAQVHEVSTNTVRRATLLLDRAGYLMHVRLGNLTAHGREVAEEASREVRGRDERAWVWVSPVFAKFGYFKTTPQR